MLTDREIHCTILTEEMKRRESRFEHGNIMNHWALGIWHPFPKLPHEEQPVVSWYPIQHLTEWVSDEALSRVRLCDTVDCSLPGSSVHGILQARILEWVAIAFSRGSSQPRDWTQVCLNCRQTLYPLRHQGINKYDYCHPSTNFF